MIELDAVAHAKARQHRLTASRAADLMSGNYKTWTRLAWDMRGEQRIIGQACGIPQLDWGIKTEPQVRAWLWERHPEWDIHKGGFLTYWDEDHPLFSRYCACSPDGLIYPVRWGLEVKAPFNPEIHLRYVRSRLLPDEYIPQVQFSLWVSNLDRWLFVTGDPRVGDSEQYMELAIAPDLAYHARMAELATRFLEGYEAGEEFQPIRPTAAAFSNMFPRRG